MGHGCSKSPSEAEEGRTGDKKERMGVSASAAARQSPPPARKGRIHSYFLEDSNNNNSGSSKKMEAFETSDLLKRIESLEQELKCKDKEITSLQVIFPELIFSKCLLLSPHICI